MGDIVEFPPLKQTRELPDGAGTRTTRPEFKSSSREELLAQGGEAYEQLGAWKSRGIPTEDRISMAKNMDAILNELRIKPKDLSWQELYRGDREAFNRDLSRMRLPAHAEPGRRLMAHNTRWIDLLNMISKACEDRGENMTLDGLAERLTRRTRFHPVQQAQTFEEKQLYKLKLWANDVDERTGLLRTFRQLSALRAEYFRLHLRDYDDVAVDANELATVRLRPSSYFTDIPEDVAALFDRDLGSYTEEDWEQFYQCIPEEHVCRFTQYQRDIENWRANFDSAKALFVNDGGDYLPLHNWSFFDFKYLPRFYLGRLDFDRSRLLESYAENVFPNGTADPLLVESEGNLDGGCYLVLYPTPELTRLIPYLLHCDQELSFCTPITEEVLGDEERCYFPSNTIGTQCISRPLIARIEESDQTINTAWFDTATDLTQHPYFAWQTSRSAHIDEELARITASIRREDNSKNGE